jgi:hypothetical protein
MHASWRPLHETLSIVFVVALAASLTAGAYFASGVMDLVGVGSDAVAGSWPTIGFR